MEGAAILGLPRWSFFTPEGDFKLPTEYCYHVTNYPETSLHAYGVGSVNSVDVIVFASTSTTSESLRSGLPAF